MELKKKEFRTILFSGLELDVHERDCGVGLCESKYIVHSLSEVSDPVASKRWCGTALSIAAGA